MKHKILKKLSPNKKIIKSNKKSNIKSDKKSNQPIILPTKIISNHLTQVLLMINLKLRESKNFLKKHTKDLNLFSVLMSSLLKRINNLKNRKWSNYLKMDFIKCGPLQKESLTI